MDEMQRPIGVFDSGVGGISVLRELVALMPNENFIFYGIQKMPHMEQKHWKKSGN